MSQQATSKTPAVPIFPFCRTALGARINLRRLFVEHSKLLTSRIQEWHELKPHLELALIND
eukprot:1150334-Pelagomonas_calceolata.AAC.5